MDPVSAHAFRGLVAQLRGDGRTILLTTHDMAEAADVCDRISLIEHGRVLTTARPAEVGRLISEYERVEVTGCPPGLAGVVARIPGVVAVSTGDTGLRVETGGPDVTREVLRLCGAAGVTGITTSRPGLEEVYLHVFGRRGMRVDR